MFCSLLLATTSHQKWTHFLDILCMILWFLWKLMLLILWQTSQNEVKRPSGGHLVQPPLYLQALVMPASQAFRGAIEAASHLFLFAFLCRPWCLPEPFLNSFSSVTWQATYKVETRMGSVICAGTVQARNEQENAAAGRSLCLLWSHSFTVYFPTELPSLKFFTKVCASKHTL